MRADTDAPHYFTDPKTGEKIWSGPSRAEVDHWRTRVELLRGAMRLIEHSAPEQAKLIASDAIARSA